MKNSEIWAPTFFKHNNSFIATVSGHYLLACSPDLKPSFKTMIGLACDKRSVVVVNDQIGTPTSAKDLASAILNILPNIVCKNVEIYHYSNEGTISWFDFAKEIFAQSRIDCLVKPISTTDYGAAVKRPLYSVLDKRKIRNDFNIDIPSWKDSLSECLVALGVKIDDRPR